MLCVCCRVVDVKAHGPVDEDLCTECRSIILSADRAIDAARRIGVPKYGPESWRRDHEHLIKAYNHLATLINTSTKFTRELIPTQDTVHYDVEEDHLGHAICRLAMARAL